MTKIIRFTDLDNRSRLWTRIWNQDNEFCPWWVEDWPSSPYPYADNFSRDKIRNTKLQILHYRLWFLISGDFLEVNPVEVVEGGETIISSQNLKVLLDTQQLGKLKHWTPKFVSSLVDCIEIIRFLRRSKVTLSQELLRKGEGIYLSTSKLFIRVYRNLVKLN